MWAVLIAPPTALAEELRLLGFVAGVCVLGSVGCRLQAAGCRLQAARAAASCMHAGYVGGLPCSKALMSPHIFDATCTCRCNCKPCDPESQIDRAKGLMHGLHLIQLLKHRRVNHNFSTLTEDWIVLTLLPRLTSLFTSFVTQFTTLKSLDYNIVMTFRFNNNNNNRPNNNLKECTCKDRLCCTEFWLRVLGFAPLHTYTYNL